MDTFITRYCLSLLILASVIGAKQNSNQSLPEAAREPRVSGRIVKLYSGNKPEPFLCLDEGFQADASNCVVFYRCVKEKSGKFNVFRFQCAPGTVYDPDVEICNYPRSTRRTECGGIMKPAFDGPHTAESNEIDSVKQEVPRPIRTKEPVYTESTTHKQPTPLFWISSTERQNLPAKRPWETNLHQTQNTATTISSLTTKHPWSASKQFESTSIPRTTLQQTAEKWDLCITEGFMGDSQNCKKFYRCVANQRGGFIRYDFSCSGTTVWDDEIQGCNHAWAVKRSNCGRSMSYDDKLETMKSQKNSDSTQISITTERYQSTEYDKKIENTIQQQLQISYGSKVAQNQTQIHYGDRIDKIKEISAKQNQTQLSNGSAVSQSQTQIYYGNKGFQTQTQIDHSKDSSQSQVQIQVSMTNIPTSTHFTTHGHDNEPNNSGKCSESGFMGDSNDCKKFYRCVDNGKGTYTKFDYSCGDGTVWDPTIEACNHAWAVKECGGKFPVEATSEGPISTMKTTQYKTESTKTTKSHYTTVQTTEKEDINDVGYGNQDPETSPHLTSSVQAAPTTEKHREGITNCTYSGFMGDENDCKIFYRCVENGQGSFTKYEFKCGDGTLWDSDIQACNHAWAVKKCSGTTKNFESIETTTRRENTLPPNNVQTTVTLIQTTTQRTSENDDYDTGYGSHNDEPIVATTTSTSTTMTVKTTKRPQDQNNECSSSGFIGDTDDCKKFYRCVDNGNGGFIRYEFSCGEGTVWDPKVEACNHAWAVKSCGGSIDNVGSQESTSPIISTTTYGETSSIQTTEVNKDTDKPIYITTSSSTSSSTTGSYVGKKCTRSGFLGDNIDCKKFYRCVDNGDGTYTRYEFTCGEGTVWDSEIDACNHAWAVEKCGSGDSASTNYIQPTTTKLPVMMDEEVDSGYPTQIFETSEHPQSLTTSPTVGTTTVASDSNNCSHSGFVGDKNDCKKFYRCVDNGKGGYDRYQFYCGQGTAWDQSIESCNHAGAVENCGESVNNTSQIESETTTQSIMGSSEDQGNTLHSTEKTTTTTEDHHENEITSDHCEQEGFFGHRKDCKKFYRCVDNGKNGFTKYEFTCGEGTAWNQDIQSCDHPSSDRPCGGEATKSPSLSDEMDTETSTKESITTAELPTTEATQKPQASGGTCDSEGFFVDPSDCKKFYRCVDNGKGVYVKYDFNCGDGTVWSQEIQACDHESDDKTCSSSVSNPTQASPSQSESTTSSYSTTGGQQQQPSTQKTEPPQSVGSDQCTSEGFFTHPNNCKKFIRCVSDGKGEYTRYEFSCGDGTFWVQEIETCDHDNGGACRPDSDDVYGSSTSQSSTSSSTQGMTPSKQEDEYQTENSNEPSPQETDKCKSEGYFGDSKDCTKFYRCVDNGNGGLTKYDFTCGEGTIWDQDITTCNHPQDVANPSCSAGEGTSDGSSTTISTTTSSSHTSSSTTEISSSNQSSSSTTDSTQSSSSTTDNTQAESSKKPTSNVTCDKAGYYPNPDDCKKFYRCVDWDGDGKKFSVFHFECGEGTIWDPALDTCNHEDSVYPPRDCSQSQSQNVSSETTTEEGTTSREDTTTESTTTLQSTMAEQTTAHQSTTSEQTTQQPTTSEKTTTQQSTTSEQTTIQQSTTNEQTTLQSTTSEKTTTQESTTSQQTTTQQSTTNEQTTQQSTTSEKTTTQDSPTSQQTTTQQSTTSEQTSTTQSTTSEKTTPQESTTSEQTTQESMTTEQTTTTEQSGETTTQSTTTDQTTSSTEAITDQSTTQASNTESDSQQTTTESSSSTTEESSSSEKECPETNDDQYLFVCPTSFRRHPKYCNMFYQCTEDEDTNEAKIAMFKCPNNTIYDESQTQCVKEDKAEKKCDGEIANRRRIKRLGTNYKDPIVVDHKSHSCPTTGYFQFEKESECSKGFLKCEKSKTGNVNGYVFQCPEGYIYWSISKRCELQRNLRDCRRSNNDWTERWNIPIERHNVAK